MSSNFRSDISRERVINNWIKNNFYENQTPIGEIRYININSNESLQHQGVDFFIYDREIFGDRKEHWIDCKSATYYSKQIRNDRNKRPDSLPTFAFELYFKNKHGEYKPGWLFSEKYKLTEFYLLSWLWVDLPKKDNNRFDLVEVNDIEYNNIKEIEIMIIDKKTIQQYATSIGITKDNFEKKVTDLISNCHEDRINLEKSNGKAWLKYTNKLQEKPVNLVIRKTKLKELAINHKIIKKRNLVDN
ncbi:hypothetical protein [Aerococcus urinaeequi]|uniref:hypothetical protein n=1 Tax=Aerococcus urinaeequi TaxID=51665 RepID=UPI000ED2D5C0|nr:hypothetical protein [Aerococcus urinaeequi]